MVLLNTADSVYLGSQKVDAVYLGAQEVWSSRFNPSRLSGLVAWLDAKTYTPGSWPNMGSGPAITLPGGTAPTVSANRLNGLPVVRFKTNEGVVRSTWPYPVHDFTVVYLVRWIGPNVGRAFGAQYPPSNFLVGFHTSKPDAMYDNGTWMEGPPVGWNVWASYPPAPWRMYEADCTTGVSSRFFIDGTLIGSAAVVNGGGLTSGWAISGYGDTTSETMDIEVAELVLYNRKLSDVERRQVEDYLALKWGLVIKDPDVLAYMTATGLNASYEPALSVLVTGLKAKGLWSKMVAIYPFIGGTAALHKWNLKDPRDLDAAYRLTYVGPVGIHSNALGYQPNAEGQQLNGGYADSHLTPRGVFDQDSTSLSYYSLANSPPKSRCEIGCYNWAGAGSRFHLIACYTGSLFYYGMAEDGVTGTPVPASTGLFVATRTGPNTQSGYRNGVVVNTTAMPSNWLPDVPIWVGGINVFQDRSDLPCGFASIGVGLSAQDNADLYSVVQAYQTALGRAI